MTKRSKLSRLFPCLLIVVAIASLCGDGVLAQGNYGFIPSTNASGIYRINLQTQSASFFASLSTYATGGVIHQSGTQLWISSSDRYIIYNPANGSIIFSTPSSSYSRSKPLFSPDGSRVYYLVSGGTVSLVVRDAYSFARIDSFANVMTSSWYAQPVLSLDGRIIYTNDYGNSIYAIDVATGKQLKRAQVTFTPSRLKLSRDGRSLFGTANYSYSGVVEFDLTSFTQKSVFPSTYYASGMEFSRDGKKLYVVDNSISSIRVYELASGNFADHALNYSSNDLALAPSDTLLYIAHNTYSSGNVSIYNTRLDTTAASLTIGNPGGYVIMPLPADNIPPDPVTGVQVIPRAYNVARIVLTAPGDDGMTGNASFYDVRYDTLPINDANFSTAKRYQYTPYPRPAGQTDTIDVTGLRGSTQYYFGIKAGDELLNVSSLGTGSVLLPPPPKIALQPLSASLEISDNDSVTTSFTIFNSGGSDLEYSLSASGLTEIEATAPSVHISDLTIAETPAGIPLERDGHPMRDLPELSYQSKEASVGPSLRGQQSVNASGPKVLLLGCDESIAIADVKSKVMASGLFSSVDTYDLRVSIPTLSFLQQFDAILVWTNYYPSDPNLLGDVLADYVDGGGGIVMMMFSMGLSTSNPLPRILGRFNSEKYWAIEPAMITYGPRATLGTVLNPSHPVMKKVTTFDGGSSSFRPSGSAVTPGSQLIAKWSDGSALVAAKKIKGMRRVDLGFYPPSSDLSSELWISSTDGATLMTNALSYVAASAGEIGAVLTPSSGVVPAGGQVSVNLTITTKDSKAGKFVMNVDILSNDPDSSSITFPVSLTIHDLTPPHASISFFQNEEYPQYLSVVCVGRESLYTPLLTVSLNGDTSHPQLMLSDTTSFVYYANYTMRQSGTLTARLTADDSVGNHTSVTRQLGVLSIAAHQPGLLTSADQSARVHLESNAFDEAIVLTVGGALLNARNALGGAYTFGPQSRALRVPGSLTMQYPSGVEPRADDRLGIYYLGADGSREYVPTFIDRKEHVLRASFAKLGTYQIFTDAPVAPQSDAANPASFALSQNFPNPFNPATVLRYAIPEKGVVRLVVFDILGREVAVLVDGQQEAGEHRVSWDATNYPNGVYVYSLTAGSFHEMKKMVLVK